jgi:hypothetical protein
VQNIVTCLPAAEKALSEATKPLRIARKFFAA